MTEEKRKMIIDHMKLMAKLQKDPDYKEVAEQLEQKEPLPAEMEGGGSSWWYVCGDCHGAININDHYCRHCGRGVTWT